MIPVSEPMIGERELALVSDAVRTGWVSSAGKYINQFERDLANYHGVNNCVALSNGTAALEVALAAVGVSEGDEVVIPSATIISVAIAVLRMKAVPRMVDVDISSWNLTAENIEKTISEKTRAIIVVHSFGHPADIDPILDLADRYDLKVVEDVAESIGSTYKGRLCGTFGHVGTFSFYANKLITTGEGGACITNDDSMAAKMRQHINLYFGAEERFSHDEIGFNFRMTNMQAALGCAQLEKINEFADKKKLIASWYRDALKSCKTVEFQKTVGPVDHVYWMFAVTLSDHVKMSAFQAMEYLRSRGIETRSMFKGLHLQKALTPYAENSNRSYAVTEHLYNRGFYLPSALSLSREKINFIVDALKGLT